MQPSALFIYFLMFQSWISKTAGNSTAELSRQVVWGAGIERVYLRVPKFRWGGAIGSKRAQNSMDLVVLRMRTASF